MARKSRKNIMPQSAAPEIRISEEVNLLRTAAYARLSSENSGHETEDTLNTQMFALTQSHRNLWTAQNRKKSFV